MNGGVTPAEPAGRHGHRSWVALVRHRGRHVRFDQSMNGGAMDSYDIPTASATWVEGEYEYTLAWHGDMGHRGSTSQ